MEAGVMDLWGEQGVLERTIKAAAVAVADTMEPSRTAEMVVTVS
jgi:hypothetical protein